MKPHKSYIIWFTPRTGSTLLCKALEQTGMAGRSGEFFNKPEATSLLDHYQLHQYGELRQHIWDLGCSANGVLGMKYSLFRASYHQIAKELVTLQDMKLDQTLEWKPLEDLFPHCRHIYLTRRNKIRQVVSWWKAIQDNQWHLKSGEQKQKSPDYYQGKYNFEALMHLLKEQNLREAITQEFFHHNQILPLTIFYEDLISNYEETICTVLRFLDEKVTSYEIDQPFFQKTADMVSEDWVQQLRSDLQKGWERQMW